MTSCRNDYFSSSVAAMGTDRVLIAARYDDTGAFDAGAAYLFGIDGTLLTTFTNPTPAFGENFGNSVAAVGTDRVLIGAPNDSTGASQAGAAYLFNTNGTLLATFTNPTPQVQDFFGFSVAAVGSDRVLISGYQDSTGANLSGAAYLFRTHGTLLTTFTNPTPAFADLFGICIAAVGTDMVVIGSPSDDDTSATNAGAAYLFSTNGALLTTFTSPTGEEGDRFGVSVAAMGTERVLIGGSRGGGVAYLFRTNGALLMTFANPTPEPDDSFGTAVAGLDTCVLVGARLDNTGGADAGAAYLFSTNGALLTTFTNPTPANVDYFGCSLAAMAGDRFLIGLV